MKGRNVSVSDLSPRAQRQAAEQLRRGRESQINEAFARQIKEHGPDSLLPADKPKRAKYGNRRTTYKNVYGVERTYDSKKEAEHAAYLDRAKRAGLIEWYIPQVRIPLPGGVAYVADFMVKWPRSGIQWIDVKGRDTPMSAAKRKIVKAIYGIEVELA